MADPLSVIASILAVVGACAASIKTIKSLIDTPHELRRLEIELDHLQAVVRDVQSMNNDAAITYSTGLSNALFSASTSVQQVSDFISTRLYQDKGVAKRVRKRACFQHRGRIKAFADDITSIRSRLIDHIATSLLTNSACQRETKESLKDLGQQQERMFQLLSSAIQYSGSSPVAALNGTPAWQFECSRSFRPVAYSIESRLRESFIIAGSQVTETNASQVIQTYYLFFAQTKSILRRVIATTAVSVADAKTAFFDLETRQIHSAIDRDQGELSADLSRHLEGMLRSQRQPSWHGTVRAVWESGFWALTKPIALDISPTGNRAESQLYQDVQDMGCANFTQSELRVIGRHSPVCYFVEARSRIFVEQKLPFADPGPDSENVARKFCDDIKRLCSLQHHPTISRFGGVVLDDSKHPRVVSYLYEAQAIPKLRIPFDQARFEGYRIPWDIREMWIAQIVQAIADLHQLGVVVGRLQWYNFDIDEHYNIVIAPIKTAGNFLVNELGNVPPELRSACGKHSGDLDVTFRSDMFQLGLLLWQIAEHLPRPWKYHFCTRNACSNRPHYRCEADHTNPVDLPPCLASDLRADDDSRTYIDTCIAYCRQADPACRPSARGLLDLLPKRPRPAEAYLLSWLARFKDAGSFRYGTLTYCSECGQPTELQHYHCEICRSNHFNLCISCVDDGIHCYDRSHQLVRRVPKGPPGSRTYTIVPEAGSV